MNMIQMKITERTSMASLADIFIVLFPVMEFLSCLLSLKLTIRKIVATRTIMKHVVVGKEYETKREITVILGLYFLRSNMISVLLVSGEVVAVHPIPITCGRPVAI